MFAMAALANASLIPVLSSELPSGSNFAFNYTANVTADERLDPTATNGVTCPGAGNTLVQCNPAGTFFTIYDIPGFISAFTTASGWTVSEQNTGATPSTINGSSFDSPALTNVTFAYTGSVVAGPATVTGFQIVSSDSGQNTSGHFTSQSTNNLGSSAGTSAQLSSSVAVPGSSAGVPGDPAPEPRSLVMIGLGVMAVLLGGARRRKV